MGKSVAHHYLPKFYLKGFTGADGLFLIYLTMRGSFKMKGKRFMLVLLQANENVCCTNKRYPDMLRGLFLRKYGSIEWLRMTIFQEIDDDFLHGP
jgi:hypothetical protein